MAKDPNTPRPPIADPRPRESLDLLKEELRRRGMTQAEIEAVLRKRKRRKALDVNAVRYPSHGFSPAVAGARPVKPRSRATQPTYRQPAQDLCTVAFAADRLQLHPKTILRFIREGRLPATRVGKSYRILRTDLDAFGGLPARAETAAADPSVTCIIDVPDVGADLAAKWAATITSALNARDGAPLRAEVIHEPERRHLKIVLVGAPADIVAMLNLVQVWIEQLRA